MARRGENIYKRKDGRYEGRFIRGYQSGNKPIWGYVYGKHYYDVRKRLFCELPVYEARMTARLPFSFISCFWDPENVGI